MVIKNNKKRKLSLLLLQESVWGIEDKLKIMVESIAYHEAEIIRLKQDNKIYNSQFKDLESFYKNNEKNHDRR